MFLLGFVMMTTVASRKKLWVVVAIGIEQHFDGHPKKPCGFPRICTTLHQPGCGRVA